MLLLTTIIYGIAVSAVSHSITLSVGNTKAKTKTAQGFYMLDLIILAVFKMMLTQITQTSTSLLADITSVYQKKKKKRRHSLNILA